MKGILAGEGATDIGDYAKERVYWDEPMDPGVLGRLAFRVLPSLRIIHAVKWCNIRKLSVGGGARGDATSIAKLGVLAVEWNADVVIFARDRDRDMDREKAVELALEEFDFAGVAVAGGTANEESEAWVMACLGEHRSEQHSKPSHVLRKRMNLQQMYTVVETANLERLPADARSLRRWLQRVKALDC